MLAVFLSSLIVCRVAFGLPHSSLQAHTIAHDDLAASKSSLPEFHSQLSHLDSDLTKLMHDCEEENTIPFPMDPFPFDESSWPMTRAHFDALQNYADIHQVALFVRPSEVDSVRLVQQGKYPTKSVDIHSKSSNWGLHAGFVPVDPFFAKPHPGQPPQPSQFNPRSEVYSYLNGQSNPVIAAAIDEVWKHNKEMEGTIFATEAGIVHLGLTTQDIQTRLRQYPPRIAPCTADQGCQLQVTLNPAIGGFPECFLSAGLTEAQMHHASVFFCRLARNTYDLTPESNVLLPVYWVLNTFQDGQLYQYSGPLHVWAYGCSVPFSENSMYFQVGSPVTGDYDLWMVGFHYSSDVLRLGYPSHSPDTLEQVLGSSDKFVAGGHSYSNIYEYELVRPGSPFNLNNVLNPSLPVFHHSSEMWNEHFTQPLPKSLVVIVPRGTMVSPAVSTLLSEANDEELPYTVDSGMLVDLDKLEFGGTQPRINRLVALMSGLLTAGYLWKLNPSYVENFAEVKANLRDRASNAEFHASYDLLRLLVDGINDFIFHYWGQDPNDPVWSTASTLFMSRLGQRVNKQLVDCSWSLLCNFRIYEGVRPPQGACGDTPPGSCIFR